ncbi:MAG: hypothetical protein M1840_001779 [Geoglossum simile]|nr:MAG: hypothetical protein M1840_001779 [Geoglossum simile]
MIKLDEMKHGKRPEFRHLCKLTLGKVIPRLLGPLQAEGRIIKPCLVHGDIWDENTAADAATGVPFIFDAGSFYAHNEYEIGNWRAPRHRLSKNDYVENYKRNYLPSELADEWDDRNILWSKNMILLCKKYCPEDLHALSGLSMGTGLSGSLGNEEIDEGEKTGKK